MAQGKRKLMLVTGGAGFIGSHLVESLLERGDRVRVFDNFCTGKMQHLEELGQGSRHDDADLEIVRNDLRDFDALRRAMEGVDGVFHQAALGSVPRSVEDPVTTQQVNADGTLHVFLAARDAGVGRVVYASSSSVYGDSELLPKREGTEGRPLSPYALTKVVNEEYARLFQDLYGYGIIGLRYFNVFGPRQDPESQYAAVIPRFVTALLRGIRPTIYGSGEQTRDFTYVKDVVAANLLAMDAAPEACGKAYNIGRGSRTSLLELLETIQDVLGIRIPADHQPPRAGDVLHSTADTGLASNALGFCPRHDLREGLQASMEWYRKNL
jgi:nucleoside-diphosphate-sugar epimerase